LKAKIQLNDTPISIAITYRVQKAYLYKSILIQSAATLNITEIALYSHLTFASTFASSALKLTNTFGDTVLYLRSNSSQPSLMVTAMNPFLVLACNQSLDALDVAVGYQPKLVYSPQDYNHAAFESDAAILASYTLTNAPIPLLSGVHAGYNLNTPVPVTCNDGDKAIDQTSSSNDDAALMDAAERDVMIQAASLAYIKPPTNETVKLNVAWCENDYQAS
jgi:hypothetical protein